MPTLCPEHTQRIEHLTGNGQRVAPFSAAMTLADKSGTLKGW